MTRLQPNGTRSWSSCPDPSCYNTNQPHGGRFRTDHYHKGLCLHCAFHGHLAWLSGWKYLLNHPKDKTQGLSSRNFTYIGLWTENTFDANTIKSPGTGRSINIRSYQWTSGTWRRWVRCTGYTGRGNCGRLLVRYEGCRPKYSCAIGKRARYNGVHYRKGIGYPFHLGNHNDSAIRRFLHVTAVMYQVPRCGFGGIKVLFPISRGSCRRTRLGDVLWLCQRSVRSSYSIKSLKKK